ncbi:hypothetical protein EW145_g5804, partial [Phellinidium pouzarii]
MTNGHEESVNAEETALLSPIVEDAEHYDEQTPLIAGSGFPGDPDSPRRRNSKRPSPCLVSYLRGRTTCCIVSAFGVGVALLVSMGGMIVYNTSPKDGLSPPWYPSRMQDQSIISTIYSFLCWPSSSIALGGTLPSWQKSYKKAAELVNQMSLVEKVNVTTGTGWQMGLCVGNTGSATSVNFPSLCLQDGPLGIRFADNSTAFPAGITVGATWNRDLMYKRGRLHGREARMKGVNVLLGPSMGPLGRMPGGGRNFEGFGADPVLQGVAAAETIKGIQEEGVMATAKHYILNEQEHFRQSFEWGLPNALSTNIDDRTLHEIYLWPFADSVRAGVASIMCSYQMVNNSYACGNSKLLNGILKDELGFQGFVQSDWLAQRSGIASALAGLDMTMPGDGLHWANGNSLWGTQLTTAVLNGSLPVARVNDMVVRIVAAYYQLGQDDQAHFPPDGPNFSSWTDNEEGLFYHGSGEGERGVVNKFVDVQGEGDDAHGRLVRQIGAEAITLLKNEGGLLPLSRDGAGLADDGRKVRVVIVGEDAGEGKGRNVCPDRGCNQGTLAVGWGSGATDFPYLITPHDAIKAAFDKKRVSISSFLTNAIPPTGALENQDVCLVFVNADAGEGYISHDGVAGDRLDLFPQKGGDKLIQAVARRCGDGNGQESGNSLVDVLFGDLDVSGRLPYTVGKTLADYGEGGQILTIPNGAIPQQNFDEGLYIDYRHFDKYGIAPRYEFGFGLSYTTFSFANLNVTPIRPKSAFPSPRSDGVLPPILEDTVPAASEALFPAGFRKLRKFVYPYIENPPSQAGGGEGGNPSLWDIFADVEVSLTNTGRRTGKEVVQLYVSFPEGVEDVDGARSKDGQTDFPPKVLRGFEKIELEPGESKKVKIALTRRDLSYWTWSGPLVLVLAPALAVFPSDYISSPPHLTVVVAIAIAIAAVASLCLALMPFQHAVDADGDVNLYPLSALPPSPSHHDGLDCSAPMKRGPSVFNCPPSPSDSAQIASLTFSPRRAPALDPSQDRPYKRPKLEEDMSDSEGSTYPVHILHRPVPDAQPSLPHPQDSNMPFASSFAGFGANSSSSSSFVSAQPSIKFASSSFTNPPSVSPNRSPFSTQSAPLALGPTSNTIWFEDGDLVLGVQDVFFRVHASRLVASAGAFAALVDAPRLLPTDREAGARAAEEISRKVRAEVHAGSSADVGVGAEYVDGCPFVPLDDDDSPRDWAVALEAMYDFLTFQIRPVIFDTLASALRISTKYDVRFLREWAIAQMRTTWPTHLDQMAPMALPHAA